MSDMPSPRSAQTRNLWPAGIVAAFTVFILATVGLIVFSTFHRVDLVHEDYYEREIRYQDELDRRDRTQRLSEATSIALNSVDQQILLALPAEHGAARPSGTIRLYRPSSAKLDREYPLNVDLHGRQVLDSKSLEAGLWRMRVTWRTGGEEFCSERDLVIGAAAAEAPSL